MKIFLIGCVKFSSEMPKELININENVVGVCTTKSSSFNTDHFNLGINPTNRNFKPNFFVNISEQIEKKISLINTYKSEIKKYPFPRSNEAIISQAKLFGSYMGVNSAEAFQLLREYEC